MNEPRLSYCSCPIEDWRDVPEDWCICCEKPTKSALDKKRKEFLERIREESKELPKDIQQDNFDSITSF